MDTPPHIHSPQQPSAVDRPTDSRPSGGILRSGRKTPRRVQWTTEPPQAISPSPRALDEHGLDPEPFETLKDALERHQSISLEGGPNNSPLTHNAPTAISPGQSLPSSPETSPLREVPGEVFIDSNETAGLPGRDIERYSQEQAQKVVQAHKYNIFNVGSKHNRPRSASDGDKMTKARRGFFKERTAAGDVEKSANNHPEQLVQEPKGVLSTLLAIYEPALQSGLSTPTTEGSRPASFYNGPASAASSVAMIPQRPPPARTGGPIPSSTLNASTLSLRPPNAPWTRKPFGDSRPPKSRGSAGVFGPLIAGTGSIAGVAAPTAATIAPDLKRPGYRLSRYSLESNLPKATSEKDIARPRSMHFDTRTQSPAVSGPTTPTEGTVTPHESSGSHSPTTPVPSRHRFSGYMKDLPKWGGFMTPNIPGTPATEFGTDDLGSGKEDKKDRERRRKRKKAEIWITRHVAEIVCRQEFILKLARAMMMFGGPTHRLQAQMKATAKVLDIELSCMYLPDTMLISFDDPATSTSNIKFIRQASALNIGKLQEAHQLHWQVTHDEISVKDASVALDELMRRKSVYKNWQIVLFGGACSAAICSVSFHGSFIDSLISFPLGCLLILIQIFAGRNELYSNVFEITVATMFSFIAAALSSYKYFCYSAIASSSVVLILPGFIVLCGSLELSSRNIVSGAVRVCFSCVYSLFLGFGLAIGATAFSKISGHPLAGSDDLTCGKSHDEEGPWWQRDPSVLWAFLTVPAFSLFLSLRNYAPHTRRELYLLVAISCVGWVTNHFTGTHFRNQSDISAAVGALAVGVVANLYGRFFNGNAFVVMITGILFQLPSGLANGGLFSFVQQTQAGSSSNVSYLSGFQTALQLISVSVGLTVGLGISLVLVHPVPSRRREGGMFSL